MAARTDWNPILRAELDAPYFKELQQFVASERARQRIYPPPDEVFAALHLTPYAEVKVLILGPGPVPRRQPGPRPVLQRPAGHRRCRRRWRTSSPSWRPTSG